MLTLYAFLEMSYINIKRKDIKFWLYFDTLRTSTD